MESVTSSPPSSNIGHFEGQTGSGISLGNLFRSDDHAKCAKTRHKLTPSLEMCSL